MKVPLGVCQRLALRALGDLESVSLLVDHSTRPPRVVVNFETKPDTALAKFLSQQPPAQSHALSRYLPEGGALRASFSIHLDALREPLETWLKDVAAETGMSPERTDQTRDLLFNSLFQHGDGALCLDHSAFAALSLPALRDIRTRLLAALNNTPYFPADIARLNTSINRAFPDLATSATATLDRSGFMAILTPQDGVNDVSRLSLLLESANLNTPNSESRKVELVKQSIKFEEFPLDQFFIQGADPELKDEALLTVCKFGEQMVAAGRYADFNSAMNRILRISGLNSYLAAHRIFLGGAHFYADIALAKSEASAPAAPIHLMMRVKDKRAQAALAIP
jgi:hypothetical protein